MAKNYLQEGKTLTFIAGADYRSGDMVLVGERLVIALTDTPKGCAGTGMAEGVFILPKKAGDTIKLGHRVYCYQGVITANNPGGAEAVGVAWEEAKQNVPRVAVKLHG